MILLALAAITYGCYLVAPALGWCVGGLFAALLCYGRHAAEQDRKQQERADAIMRHVITGHFANRAEHEASEEQVRQRIQNGARFTRN